VKIIQAIIRPEKLGDVKAALEKADYPGMTISDVDGHGRQKGLSQQWRGEQFKLDLVPKIKIEIAVTENAEAIINAIVSAGCTGEVGDGKIFVWELADAVRIRTGERGAPAI
jgi:nitrogen regulatory protein P-II 1